MISLEPLGDRAFLATFAAAAEAASWASAVRERSWAGILDVVTAYQTAAVFADPELADLDQLEASLRELRVPPETPADGNLIQVPVLYDGVDLPEIAHRLGRSEAEVVQLHTTVDYYVYAIGFLPGFPYAGDLPEALCGLERRAQPRQRVPAGSIAIVGRQTCIYPQASPGGWHLIGRTPLRIVDLENAYFPIRAGDRLRFELITEQEFEARRGELL